MSMRCKEVHSALKAILSQNQCPDEAVVKVDHQINLRPEQPKARHGALLWVIGLAVSLAVGGWVFNGREAAVHRPSSRASTRLETPFIGLRQHAPREPENIQLCQALGPAAPCPILGVDCAVNGPCGGNCGDRHWKAMGPIDWQAYAQGEYVGHWRLPHVPVYRLRVDDIIECAYRLTRDIQPDPYRLNVGDEVQVESFTDQNLNRNLIIQPDGTITLRLLGEVRAAGLTVPELRGHIEDAYQKYYKLPSITVTPLRVNTQLDDLRAVVDNRAGRGGQGREVRVTPAGTIDLPGLNNIPAQGLTLDELKAEISFRYQNELGIQGMEVTPILTQRAPRFVYVFGEVNTPNRFTMEGPTTLMQAISMAGSWKVGANLRQIAIFRRGDDWRLMATLVNMQGTMLFNRQPCPAGEIWLDDGDIVMVPKTPVLIADDLINLYFTRGLYSVLPFSTFYSFNQQATVLQ
jgi:polysaccharide biosynthesis/export protein